MKRILCEKFSQRLVTGAIAFCMLAVPTGIHAQEESIVDGSGTSYSTIADAIANGDGTIRLLNDVTEGGINVGSDKTITLDLNGKTLKLTSNYTKTSASLAISGNVTIKGNGTLTKTQQGYLVDNKGTLTIENGTYTDISTVPNEINGKNNSALFRNLGTMKINDGSFADSGIVIKNDDSSASAYGKLTINGGTFTGEASGPNKETFYPVVQNSGDMTINQGVFTGNLNVIRSHFWKAPTKTTIVDGTFTTTSGHVFVNYFELTSGPITNDIKGGSFNGIFGTTFAGVR